MGLLSMGGASKYFDNFMNSWAAANDFVMDKNAPRFAKKLARQVWDGIQESNDRDLSTIIDKQEFLNAISALVDLLEPAFGLSDSSQADEPTNDIF